MAMAKKAAVKKTDKKPNSNWANEMSKKQKASARKGFSNKLKPEKFSDGTLATYRTPKEAQAAGRKLIKSSNKLAKTIVSSKGAKGNGMVKQWSDAAERNNLKAMKSASKRMSNPAISVGEKKAAAIQNYAVASRRSTKRKRGE